MRFVWTLVLAASLAVCLSGADKPRKKKSPKPPDIEVIESVAYRTDGEIALDGRIRNSGEKPIRGLVLVFDFMAPGRAVVTSQKGAIDEELLAPGDESVFRMKLNDPVRAVEYKISAVDGQGRDLSVAKAGPFFIE
ncbi:MAG: hypothetical protein WD696_09935 [Bryobacteraceae bacterium]